MKNNSPISRKKFLAGSSAAVAGVVLSGSASTSGSAGKRAAPKLYQNGRSPWPIALSTSTIRPAGDIADKVAIAAETGYDGIEVWEGELNDYEEAGGDLKELGQQIKSLGMEVPNVIALWEAIPPTQEEWLSREEDHRRRFRQASEVGSRYIQTVLTPPRNWQEYDLNFAAEKYHELLEMGINDYDVIPAIKFLQFLPHVQRIGQASAIALNADHPEAKLSVDVFHMYRGGSGWNGLKHLQGSFLAIFHIDDVPPDPPREELEDEHRIYPGDGIFPLSDILTDLQRTGYDGFVSLMLYNRSYWEQDPHEVARTGLEKTLTVIEEAVGG